MFARALRKLFLATALVGLTTAPGCDKTKMQELETPADGVRLAWNLAPGAAFEGRVHHKRTDGAVGSQQSTRKLDFDVALRVLSVEDEVALVGARISGLDMTWNVPMSPVNLNDFVAASKDKLNGMEVKFRVDGTGDLVEFPEAPDDLTQEDQFVMEAILDGLQGAFYVVPARNLKKGEAWEDERKKGRKGKLGRYYEENTKSVFDGLYETDDEKPRKVAQLSVESTRMETITTKAGGHETKTIDRVTVLFDIDAEHLALVDGRKQKFDGAQGSNIEFKAEWTRVGSGAAGAAAPEPEPEPEPEAEPEAEPAPAADNACSEAGEDVECQAGVTDPCNDDYVGGEECTDPCSPNYMGDEPCPN
jgi:hypothetical protein